MIRFDSTDWPKTIALPQGATVTVRRPTVEMRLDLAVATDGLLDAVPVPENGPQLERFVGLQKRLFRYTKAVACLGIESWEGIEDADGTPLPCTPESIAAVLDHVTGVWQALYRDYVEPHFLEVDAEKNASTPSHVTTGAGAGTIAAPAETSATTVEAPVLTSPTDQAASKAA